MATRIYKSVVLHGDGVQKEYLVRASSRGQVRQHRSFKFMAVKPASPEDVADLLGRGVKLETYDAKKIKAEEKQDALPLPGGGDPPSEKEGSSLEAGDEQ